MTDALHTSLHTPLHTAVRMWRHNSLRPYLSLLGAAVLAALGGYFQFGLSLWLCVALPIIAMIAALADSYWRQPRSAICRQLDCRYPALQDSSQLLLSEFSSPIAQLQRQRTEKALARLLRDGELKHFAPRTWRPSLLSALAACGALLLSAMVAPQLQRAESIAAEQPAAAHQSLVQGIASAVTRIRPQAYTGLQETAGELSFRATENAEVQWEIELREPVEELRMLAANAEYAFSSSETLPSKRWQLTRTIAHGDFYQLQLRDTQGTHTLPGMHDIEVIPDRPPEFQFTQPQMNATQASDSTKAQRFPVDVCISDDYRVRDAEIVLTLASGDGENVRFRNETLPLSPAGTEGGSSHYKFDVPVQRFAIEPGDEIYWYLQARDNREPEANVAKSAHFIIRWPQQEIFGLSDAEGMAIKVLPEYFRSQRQLIIDTEALLLEREILTDEQFQRRSTSLAYEQNLLRMRYGRFLGEEDSGLEHGGEQGGAHGPDAHKDAEHDGRDGHAEHEEPAAHGETPAVEFGSAEGVVAAAGHQHDSSEHATLFDPQTKELLRSALNAMWSSWRELSIVEPRASLPHQHMALRYIKEVQQASRIYLQRVGFEPPPLDEERRLSGERNDIVLRQASAEKFDGNTQEILQLLRELQGGNRLNEESLAHMQSLPQLALQPEARMALAKAVRRYFQESLQQSREGDCVDCREALSAILYELLPLPDAEPQLPRERAAGGHYREWLEAQSAQAQEALQ